MTVRDALSNLMSGCNQANLSLGTQHLRDVRGLVPSISLVAQNSQVTERYNVMSPASTTSTTSSEKALEHLLELQEQVRRRAYELYELRGKEDGHDLEDWLQAESEFVKPKTKAVAV
jgi:hypothetical protein